MRNRTLKFKFTLRTLNAVNYESHDPYKFLAFNFEETPNVSFCIGNKDTIYNYKKIAKFFREANIQRSIPLRIKFRYTLKPFLKKLNDGYNENSKKLI